MDLVATDVEGRTFDVVRKGYDKEQVDSFLTKVSRSMARIDDRRTIAEVRCEQLESEIYDVRTRAETTIQETVAARARLIEASSRTQPNRDTAHHPDSKDHRTIEAQQIIEQANTRSIAIQAEAEAVLQGALSTSAKISLERDELLGSVGAEREGLLAAAAAEADVIRSEALQYAEHIKAETALHAAETREKATTKAALIAENATDHASAVVAGAERQRDDLLEQIERSRSKMRLAEERSVTARPATADESPTEVTAAGAEEPKEPMDDSADLTDEMDRIAVDLRETQRQREPEPPARTARPSRYRSRSAKLPHLGEDAGSVIGSLDSLRSKD